MRQLSARRFPSIVLAVAAAVVAAGVVATAPPASATSVAPLPVGARPNATRVDFPVGDRVGASVDVGTGNLLVNTTDLTLPGIQGDVQLGLDFNSLLLGAGSPLPSGSPGPGWQMRLGQDTKLILNTDGSVLYLAPGGLEGLYQPSGGSSYTTPAGFKNALVKTGTTGWTLTEHNSGAVSTFNASGVLTKVTDRNGQNTALTYTSGQVSKIQSTQGGTGASTANVSFSSGLVTGLSQTGDAGIGTRTVTYTYSPKLIRITDAAGRITHFGYNSPGDLTSITNTGGQITDFSYDSNHKVTSVTRENPGGTDATTRFSYVSGTQTQVAGPDTNQSLPVSSVPNTTYTIDGTNRVSQAVDPVGHTRSATYTPFTDVATATSGTGGQSTFAHSGTVNNGESLTGTTAPTGATSSLAYTNTGATQFLPSGGTDSQGSNYVLSYDGPGNQSTTANNSVSATSNVQRNVSAPNTDGTLKNATDPKGNVTAFTDNTSTHQITGINPPSGSGLGNETLTYDGYGRLSTVLDGRGVTTTYSYDNLDRITSIAYSDGTGTVTNTYDTAGTLHTRADGTGTVTYGYDPLNRLTTRTATTGGGTETYGYDPAGNQTSLADGRGTTTSGYDAANELTSMNTAEGQLINFAYNGDGKRTDTWYATNSGNTTWAAHTITSYDSNGRVSESKTVAKSSAPTTVTDTSYCYSPHVTGQPCPTTSVSTDTGLIQWQKDNLSSQISTFSYDHANRLTGATNFVGHDYAYTYDKNGNRTTVTVDGTQTQNLGTFNPGNQPSATGYTFDGTGELTADPAAGTHTYNGRQQMTAQSGGSTGSYVYAGADQRELTHQTVPGGTNFDYTYGPTDANGNPELEQLNKAGTRGYLDYDATGTPLALHIPSHGDHYLVPDGHGSIVALINASGTLTATYTYDPYGLLTASTNPGGGAAAGLNPYGYAGGFNDRGTNWLKYGVRWYDPSTGRWTQQDPITQLLNPNNANPYAYAAANPINNIDPTGQGLLDAIGSVLSYLNPYSAPSIPSTFVTSGGAIGNAGGLVFEYTQSLTGLAGGLAAASGGILVGGGLFLIAAGVVVAVCYQTSFC
jgi:RHS repeat-associated protein